MHRGPEPVGMERGTREGLVVGGGHVQASDQQVAGLDSQVFSKFGGEYVDEWLRSSVTHIFCCWYGALMRLPPKRQALKGSWCYSELVCY